MPIELTEGVPRAGKGVWTAATFIWKPLTTSERCIITSLSIDLDKLQEACDKRFPEKHIHVPSRVKRLTDRKEIAYFWRHRACRALHTQSAETNFQRVVCGWEWPVVGGTLVDKEWSEKLGGIQYCEADIKPDEAGVLYVIDEAHLHFSSRAVRKIGPECYWYVTQHAHWGDDIVLLTQRADKVDGVFVDLAEQVHQLTNYGKRVYRGMAAGQWFKRLSFWGMPSKGQPADNVTAFRLPEVIKEDQWYSSKGGVGIETLASGSPDASSSGKGVPVWVWVPLLIALVVGVYYAVEALPRMLFRHFTPAGIYASPVAAVKPSSAKSPEVSKSPPEAVLERLSVAVVPKDTRPVVPSVIGWGVANGMSSIQVQTPEGAVYVIDGRQLTVGAAGVLLDGVVYPMGRRMGGK